MTCGKGVPYRNYPSINGVKRLGKWGFGAYNLGKPIPMAHNEKPRESFQEIIERKKREGNYRELTPDETLVDPKAFKAEMRKVREDFIRKSHNSWIRLRDVILD